MPHIGCCLTPSPTFSFTSHHQARHTEGRTCHHHQTHCQHCHCLVTPTVVCILEAWSGSCSCMTNDKPGSHSSPPAQSRPILSPRPPSSDWSLCDRRSQPQPRLVSSPGRPTMYWLGRSQAKITNAVTPPLPKVCPCSSFIDTKLPVWHQYNGFHLFLSFANLEVDGFRPSSSHVQQKSGDL